MTQVSGSTIRPTTMFASTGPCPPNVMAPPAKPDATSSHDPKVDPYVCGQVRSCQSSTVFGSTSARLLIPEPIPNVRANDTTSSDPRSIPMNDWMCSQSPV